jgi:hypothetical protein
LAQADGALYDAIDFFNTALYYDPNDTTYYFNDTEYTDQATFLTAIGGEVNSGQFEVGGFVPAGNTELILNGTFDSNVDNWSVDAGVSPPNPSIAHDTDRLELTANGAGWPYAYQFFDIEKSKAYVCTATVGQGTGADRGVRFSLEKTTFSNSELSYTALLPGWPNTRTAYVGSLGDQTQLAFRHDVRGPTAGGVYLLDDVSVKECQPFNGFTPGEVSGRITGTTPSDTSGTQALFYIDPNEEQGTGTPTAYRQYIRVGIEDGDWVMRVRYRSDTTSTTQELGLNGLVIGTATANAPFDIQFAVTTEHASAKLDSETAVVGSIDSFPAAAFVRLNRGQATDEDFGTTDAILRLYKTFTPPEGVTLDRVALHGDSYATGLKSDLSSDLGKAVVSTAIGGTTLQQIYDNIVAAPDYYSLDCVVWDGSPNGYGSVSAYMDIWQDIKDLLGDTLICAVPPVARRLLSGAENTAIGSIQTQMDTMFTYYVDAQQLLEDANNGSADDLADVAAGYVPRSLLQSDGVHLNAAGRAAVLGDGTSDNGILHRLAQIAAL